MSDGMTDRRSQPDKELPPLSAYTPSMILNHVRSGYITSKASTDDLMKTISYLKSEVKKRVENL